MPIFGGVGVDALELLLERAAEVHVPEGDYFFREGSAGTSAYVLEAGMVSILKRSDSDDHCLRTLETGDCFGEVALFDFGPRSASVFAESDCNAIELTTRDLIELSKVDLKQYALIYMNLGREVSRRLREADERLFKARLERNTLADGYSFSSS
jgi:CRP/FNR family cyclic AMP-dependent transcriptional regulator